MTLVYCKAKGFDQNCGSAVQQQNHLQRCRVPDHPPYCKSHLAKQLCHCFLVFLVLKSIRSVAFSAWTVLLNSSLKMMVTLASYEYRYNRRGVMGI